MKKIISIVLAFVMIIVATPAAFAAEGDYVVSGIYEGAYCAVNENIIVKVTTTSETNDIEKVVFVDGETETTDAEAPFEWNVPNKNLGEHTLEVYVHDIYGDVTLAKTINYTTFMGVPVATDGQDFEGETPTISTADETLYDIVECENLDGNALMYTGSGEINVIDPGTRIGWDGDIKVIYQEFDVYQPTTTGRIILKFGYPEYIAAHGSATLIAANMAGTKTRIRIIYDIVNRMYSVYQGDTVISEGALFAKDMQYWTGNNSLSKKDFCYSLDLDYFTEARPVYFDNFKTTAYTVAPDFTAEMVREGDSSYKITFSNNLLSPTDAEDCVDLFDVEGNKITTGVSKTSGDNYVMLTIDETQINSISDCSIIIADEGIFDEYSQEYEGKIISFADFKVTGVTLDKSTIEIARKMTDTLVATVLPEDAIDKSVIWSSSDDTIATVDQNGVVRGIRAGEATITVTTVDGNLTDTCIVTVKNPTFESTADESITKFITFAPGQTKVAMGSYGAASNFTSFSTDYVRGGEYSFRYNNPGTTGNHGFKIDAEFVGGSGKQLKFWVYNAKEQEVTFQQQLKAADGAMRYGFVTVREGWNLLTFDLDAKKYASLILYGGNGTAKDYSLDMYFSEPWLGVNESLFTIAGTSPAAGEVSVSNKLRSYRVTFSNNLLNKEKAMAAINLFDENNQLVEGVTKSAGVNYVDINIYDNVTLDYNTTYTVKINSSGLWDMIGQEYKGVKEFSFTTVSEGRNLKPHVELISPIDFERYFEGESNILKARAVDDDGTITRVEFYNGSNFIGVGTNVGEDIYVFEWANIPVSQSVTDLHSITAVAYDNNGESSRSVVSRVLVYDMKSPILNATFPGKYYSSINGAKVDKYALTGTVSDLDGKVVSIKVIEDEGTLNEKTTTIENPEAIFEFVSETDFALGEHTIKLIAIDNTGQESILEESFTAVAASKTHAKKLDSVDVKDKTNVNLFKTSVPDNKANISIDSQRGVVISSVSEGNIDVSKTATNAKINATIWQMDVTVRFDTTTNKREIKIADKMVVTFDKDGQIKAGGNVIGKYAADTNYTVSLIANPMQNLAATLIDGVVIEDGAELLATTYESGAMFQIVQYCGEGETAETVIANYGCYEVGTPVTNLTVRLAGNADLNNVPVTPGEIQISVNGGISSEVNILETVQLIDVQTGKSCLLELKDGKLLVGERLMHDSNYVIKVSSDFFNTSGATALGDFAKLSFKTVSKPLMVNRTEAGFTANTLENDATSATFNAKVKNANPSVPKTVYVVCAVYDGDKMVKKVIQECVIDSAEELVSVTAPISIVTENMSVQAFIVENLLETNTKTITEEIFLIK